MSAETVFGAGRYTPPPSQPQLVVLPLPAVPDVPFVDDPEWEQSDSRRRVSSSGCA